MAKTSGIQQNVKQNFFIPEWLRGVLNQIFFASLETPGKNFHEFVHGAYARCGRSLCCLSLSFSWTCKILHDDNFFAYILMLFLQYFAKIWVIFCFFFFLKKTMGLTALNLYWFTSEEIVNMFLIWKRKKVLMFICFPTFWKNETKSIFNIQGVPKWVRITWGVPQCAMFPISIRSFLCYGSTSVLPNREKMIFWKISKNN